MGEPGLTKTVKLHLLASSSDTAKFQAACDAYAAACDFVSSHVFENGFCLNSNRLQNALYQEVRSRFGLKSQMAVSVFKTVTARYKTVQTQLGERPLVWRDPETKEVLRVPRTLEWLWRPVEFSRPQLDLVRGRDWSFVDGGSALSINTLEGRMRVAFDRPERFEPYFSDEWRMGTAKLVSLKGQWYLHVPVTYLGEPVAFDREAPAHVVGIDRGLRFLAVSYDEQGRTAFFSGKEVARRRGAHARVRAELQAKGTKSAKRALKRLAGRENRWMCDVNHRISKTLVDRYGKGTLFVLEDLSGVSFDSRNLSKGSAADRQLRSWPFYQLEQMLSYKAREAGGQVLKVSPELTSQRCPKCGRVRKGNRDHKAHEYVCDACGYRSNDDRLAAMNIQQLGAMYVSGDSNPRFGRRKS